MLILQSDAPNRNKSNSLTEGLNLNDSKSAGQDETIGTNNESFDRHTLTRLPKRSKNNLLPLAAKNASDISSEDPTRQRNRFMSQDLGDSRIDNSSSIKRNSIANTPEIALANAIESSLVFGSSRKIHLQKKESNDTTMSTQDTVIVVQESSVGPKIKPIEVQDRRNTTKSYKSLSSLKSFETHSSTVVSQKNGSMNDLLESCNKIAMHEKPHHRNSEGAGKHNIMKKFQDRIRVFDRRYLESMACDMKVNEFVEVSSLTGESVCSLFRKAGYLGYLSKCNMSFPLYEDLLKVRGMSE